MMNPLVSIIIPYYNRPEKLQRAIDSIVAQTHSNFEIIIGQYYILIAEIEELLRN